LRIPKTISIQKEPQYRPWLASSGFVASVKRNATLRKNEDAAYVVMTDATDVGFVPNNHCYFIIYFDLLLPSSPRLHFASLASRRLALRVFVCRSLSAAMSTKTRGAAGTKKFGSSLKTSSVLTRFLSFSM
jgi:hypothetical protein